LSSALAMNCWPPNPGLTDMIRTWSTSPSTHSIASSGVAGLSTTARPLAELADLVERAVQVRAGLDVDPDQVGAGVGVRADPALGILDHEVDVERQPGRAADRRHHHRPDRQVGDECRP